MAASHFTLAALAAMTFGALGPRLFGPHDKPAGTPFVYTPPPGFVTATDDQHKAVLGEIVGGQKVWLFPLGILETYTSNITETHTGKAAVVDEASLANLAAGMPALFQSSGIVWKEVRHETRTRADGTRVALILGDCTKGTLHYDALQMVFPDDTGSSIITASYPADTASRWEPLMDKSIESATGVALHVGPPANWLYAAWGLGGGLIVFLALGALAKRPRPEQSA